MPVVFAPLKILDDVVGDLYSSAKTVASLTKEAFCRNLEVGFSTYMSTKYDRYSKVHTLLSPHKPVNVEDIYVHPALGHSATTIFDENSVDFLFEKRILVVQAIAGHGKSMFIREMFCRLCKLNFGVIPLLIELRDVDFDKLSITDVAYEELSPQGALFSRTTFDKLAKSGKILFLLDGFDEVKTAQRTVALRKIDQLTRDFPTSKVVVTSRPTDIFNGWGPVTILNIKDYDLPQILALVDRSPITGDVRDAFSERVQHDYIKTHRKFLSNPLLCNMMILTFMRGGAIYQNRNIFFTRKLLIRSLNITMI